MATATAPAGDLADFDDDFPTAKKTYSGGGDFDLADLKDGEYEFDIASAEVKSGPMFKFNLVMMSEGPHAGGKIEKCYFLTKKVDGLAVKNERSVAELKEALSAIGFDVENWTKENGRLFSAELPKVVAMLGGMRVVAKKKQGGKKEGGGHFQNLDIVKRGSGDGKPEKIGAKELEEANADPFPDS